VAALFSGKRCRGVCGDTTAGDATPRFVKIILWLDTTDAETHIDTEPAAIRAWAEGRTSYVELRNAEIVAFPADRFPILSKATGFIGTGYI
jgi:hypothetical protein